MALGFRKFISEVFVNGKFPKILPSENFLLYGILMVYTILPIRLVSKMCFNSEAKPTKNINYNCHIKVVELI